MAESAGGIYYDIELETAKLMTGSKKAADVLSEIEKNSEKADKSLTKMEGSAKSAGSTLGSLSRVAAALTAALSVQQIGSYADAWTNLNNKLSNSIRTGESLNDVTERIFQITQSTRSSLDATATLYSRLERGTREYNTSAADLAKLTTIINQGFVVSGATATEAENAIIQLSQGIASGVLRGEEFNSVSEQGSRLMVALADSLGVGIGQLRNMAAQGKLTTDVVVNGLLSQGNAIGKEFANTTMTISQASQIAGNNITKFVGSSATVKTGVMVFNDAVITLSENLTTVSNIILAITAVMGSRYVSALTAATASTIANAAAATRAAIAQGSLVAALRAALTPLGGLVGAATLASAAIYYFYQRAQQAKQEAIDFADKLDGVIAKMRQMNDVQLSGTIADLNTSLRAQVDQLSDLQAAHQENINRLYNAQQALNGATEGSWAYRSASAAVSEAQDMVAQSARDVDSAENKLSRTKSTLGIAQAQLSGQLKQGIDLLRSDGEEAGVAAGMMNHLGNAINFASRAKDKFNSSSLELPRSDKADAYNADLEKQNTLLSIADKRLRAVTKARMDAQEKGGNVNQVNTAGDLAGQQYDLEEAENKRNKTTKNGTKTTNEAANAIANLERQIGTVNLRYDENTREAAQFNAVQALGSKATEAQKQRVSELAGALYDAQQKQKDMNAAVESDPLRKENKAYSDSANQLKRQLAGNIIDQQQYNQQSEQLEVQHQAALAQIRANQSVTPQQQAAATVDPVQQLANENAQKLALIQQFTQQRILTEQQGLALMNAANTQYEQQRVAAQWAIFTQQSVGYEALGAAVDSFGQGAGSALSSVITGTQSASDAARSLANTVLTSVIQAFVDMGIQQAKSAIMGATVQQSAIAATTAASVAGTATTTTASTAAAATTATAWTPAAIVASIGSFGGAAAIGIGAVIAAMALSSSIAGKRKNGGSVSAGSMYQVGESGLPEIYKASNGRQYMIPGDSGKVISNKDIQGGGGSGVIVNVNNYTSSQVSVDSSQDGSQIIDILITDAESGGAYSSILQSTFGLTRQANGDY